MQEIKLIEDLKAIDGEVIAKAGSLFDAKLSRNVSKSSENPPVERIWAEPFKSDWERVLDESNYSIILERNEDRDLIGEIFTELSVSKPIFNELESMKAKDYYTYRHIFMTTSLSIVVSKRLKKTDNEILKLAHSALTHDFGKMRIPFNILKSANKLNKAQYRFIYQHPIMGHLLLLHYHGKERPLSAEIALKHHEYPNKSGYPIGIAQTDESIGIITVNDIFDALISPRSYRKEPYDIRGALDLIWDGVLEKKLFENPAKCLISFNRKDKPEIDKMTVHTMKRGLPPKESNYGPSDEG